MALKWVDAFVAACKSRLFPQYPYLINGLLKCIAETDNDQIRKSAESISQAMMKQVIMPVVLSGTFCVIQSMGRSPTDPGRSTHWKTFLGS